MKRGIEMIFTYVMLVICACYFAYRAWGYYPAMFVGSCGGLAIALLNMREAR
jgi:hypothetical protein